MFASDSNSENFDRAAEPLENNQTPAEDQSASAENTATPKRNSGRTGPTSTAGRATSARNAIRHGMCATTLLLPHESEADWEELLNTWLSAYQHPADNTLLYTFVLKTAQAEWHRLRIQHEYDFHLCAHHAPPIGGWEPHEIKSHDLVQRYLTAAERKFQREYRMLEHHWKSHHKPTPEPKQSNKQPAPEPPKTTPKLRFVNLETGESVDSAGNKYPPPPDWKPRTITPGVYPPNHPAYEGPR